MDTAPPNGSLRAHLAVPAAAAGSVALFLFLMSLPTLAKHPDRWLDGLLSYEGGWFAFCTILARPPAAH